MVEVKDIQSVPGKEEWFVGNLEGTSDGGCFGVAAESVCYDRSDMTLLAFSGLCGQTEVKSVRGQMCQGKGVKIAYEEFPHARRRTYSTTHRLRRCEDGYTVASRQIARHQYHVVAIARDPQFMPDGSEEAVWQYLVAHTTTPCARSWVPTLIENFVGLGWMYRPESHGPVLPAMLKLDTAKLDKLVTGLVRAGKLRIE